MLLSFDIVQRGFCHFQQALLLGHITVLQYIDAAYCYRPSSVVCWSVTLVNPAKTTEPIDMLFGLRTRVGRRNYVLDGGHRHHSPMGRGNFEGGKWRPIVKYRDILW